MNLTVCLALAELSHCCVYGRRFQFNKLLYHFGGGCVRLLKIMICVIVPFQVNASVMSNNIKHSKYKTCRVSDVIREITHL